MGTGKIRQLYKGISGYWRGVQECSAADTKRTEWATTLGGSLRRVESPLETSWLRLGKLCLSPFLVKAVIEDLLGGKINLLGVMLVDVWSSDGGRSVHKCQNLSEKF